MTNFLKIMELASELLSEERQQEITDIVLDEMRGEIKNAKLQEPVLEVVEKPVVEVKAPKVTKIPAKKATTFRKPVEINGKTFPSRSQAAEYCGVTPTTLGQWISSGKLDEMIKKRGIGSEKVKTKIRKNA